MLRKCVASVLIVTLSLLCLPVFSFASEQNITAYASIPRPVPTFNTKFVLVQNETQTESYLYMISIPGIITQDVFFQANPTSWSNIDINCISAHGLSFSVSVIKFNLYGHFVSHTIIDIPSDLDASPVLSLSLPDAVFIDFFDIPVLDNGMFWQHIPSVAWNDATDPDVYTTWLNSINSTLNEIDSNTDNIEDLLSSINLELDLFNNVFNSYKSEQHSDLQNIYSKLDEIYQLLNEEESTRAPAIENESEVQNVLQDEAALNKDFSGDLNQQFNVAGNIFESSSAFSFISNLFQELVLDVPALNSLVIFSLAIGLCVLILGRRLNA